MAAECRRRSFTVCSQCELHMYIALWSCFNGNSINFEQKSLLGQCSNVLTHHVILQSMI